LGRSPRKKTIQPKEEPRITDDKPKKSKKRKSPANKERKLFANPAEMEIGAFMMGGAALWFFAGWMAGRMFFYPFILFVIGIGTFVRGLMGEGGTW